MLARALRILEQAFGPNHPHVALSLSNLGRLYAAQGMNEEAERLLRLSLELLEASRGALHPDLVPALVELADLRVNRGDPEGAEGCLRAAHRACGASFGEFHLETRRVRDAWAGLLAKLGRFGEAGALRRRSRRAGPSGIRKGLLPPRPARGTLRHPQGNGSPRVHRSSPSY
ncbi:MAG: tetratricopeptide repeat protein [Candidatus Omnitrophica bacterium]|nr:tetratricopeptide repeat protein [Candidatus Omnitrophota bacterium]